MKLDILLTKKTDALTVIKDFGENLEKLTKVDFSKLKEFHDSEELSDIFNAYDYIYEFIEEPFNNDVISTNEQSLFNASVFLVNKISSFKSYMSQFKAINPCYVFYSLGILAK